MELSQSLKDRVREELQLKQIGTGEMFMNISHEMRSASIENRLAELEADLDESLPDSDEDTTITDEDIRRLSAELAHADVCNPEWAAEIEAIVTGQFDVESAVSAIEQVFEEVFTERWLGLGLHSSTIGLILAERQQFLLKALST